LTTIGAPFDRVLGGTPEEFLENLPGPSWFVVKGSGPGRPRLITTLLHGNEPSGFRALHRWLLGDPRPAVDVHVCVASVEAARTPPLFTWRERRGGTDLNRVFQGPFTGFEGELAKNILTRIEDVDPEAIVDLHNASGSTPSFSLAACVDGRHRRLSSFFTQRMVRVGTPLGTLMEAVVDRWPSLIVECGGAADEESDAVAYHGIKRFTEAASVFDVAGDNAVELLENPVRIRLREGLSLEYAEERSEADVTLREDIDRFNYGETAGGELVGWVGDLEAFEASVPAGRPPLDELLRVRGGRLETARPLRFLLATTRTDIGASDCLFYVIPSS
jgi:hypothetical protein